MRVVIECEWNVCDGKKSQRVVHRKEVEDTPSSAVVSYFDLGDADWTLRVEDRVWGLVANEVVIICVLLGCMNGDLGALYWLDASDRELATDAEAASNHLQLLGFTKTITDKTAE